MEVCRKIGRKGERKIGRCEGVYEGIGRREGGQEYGKLGSRGVRESGSHKERKAGR